MRVQDIMSSPVVTVSSTTGIKEAAELLVEHGFSALPVVDRGRLVGIVTEADLVAFESVPDPRSHIIPLEADAGTVPRTVAEVMTPHVIALPPEADAARAAQAMLARGLRSIPVTEGERLVGIVTRRDLLRVLARADDEIGRELAALLAEELPGEPVTVTVADGVVTLAGQVPDPHDRAVAELLARTVPGVVSVSVRWA